MICYHYLSRFFCKEGATLCYEWDPTSVAAGAHNVSALSLARSKTLVSHHSSTADASATVSWDQMRSAQTSSASFKTMFGQVVDMPVSVWRYEWNTIAFKHVGVGYGSKKIQFHHLMPFGRFTRKWNILGVSSRNATFQLWASCTNDRLVNLDRSRTSGRSFPSAVHFPLNNMHKFLPKDQFQIKTGYSQTAQSATVTLGKGLSGHLMEHCWGSKSQGPGIHIKIPRLDKTVTPPSHFSHGDLKLEILKAWVSATPAKALLSEALSRQIPSFSSSQMLSGK